jgi:predicted transcriptional regulator
MTFEPDIRTFRPDRPGIRKVLGDLEAEVMEAIWTHSETQGITVRDVFEVLYAPQRRIAYTTIMNTMTRLAKKQMLRVEKRERGYVYYPNFTQQEFIARFVECILENLFVNFSGATIAGIKLLPDPQAAQEARRLLNEIEQRHQEEEER